MPLLLLPPPLICSSGTTNALHHSASPQQRHSLLLHRLTQSSHSSHRAIVCLRRRFPAASLFQWLPSHASSGWVGESTSSDWQCSKSACMCSCSSRIVVLTPTVLCCAALLRPQIAVWLHPTASLLCARTKGVQSTAPSTTQHSNAPLAALAMHAQQMRHLRSSGLQPTSAAVQHLGQLRFREDLMHELLEQLPRDQKPQRAGIRPNPATALAKDHFPERTAVERRCAQCCGGRQGRRVESTFICNACGVHLCIGECFAAYHAQQ